MAESCFAKADVEGSNPFFRFLKKSTMTNSIYRDLKKRRLFSKYELLRLHYKSLIQDLTLSKNKRFQLISEFNKLPRNSSRVRIQNRCILTGRSHSVYRFCKLSRIKIRELASTGLLMGVKKSSW